MLFLWILLYGGIYLLAEQISEWVGTTHCVTAFATLLYAVALVCYSNRKSQRKLCPPHTLKMQRREIFVLLPLLAFPIGNLLTVQWEWKGYLLLLACSASVVEEIFFRGYLLFCFKTQKWLGAIVTSGAFALLHLVNLGDATPAFVCMQVLSAFAAGLCFCGLTLRYKSLLPATLLHVAINLTGFGEIRSSAGWYAAVVACSALYALYGVFYIKRHQTIGERE